MAELDGKVAVITGGASGIGEGTVRKFVEEGARVIIADIHEDHGHALAEELGSSAAAFIRTNVASEDDIANAVAQAVQRFGRLDTIFNNAGFGGVSGPIAETAVELGTKPLWQVMPVLVVVLAGGFVTNFVWCLFLNARNRTFGDSVNFASAPIAINCLFATIAGVTWYLQFMFSVMGTTQMGTFEFSSWTLHMAFIIVFGNLWGVYFREWAGTRITFH